jgi:hypothetical protein
MRAKAHSWRDGVIVQYAQGTKLYAIWIVPACKTKGVFGLKPTVVCRTSRISGVKYFFHTAIVLFVKVSSSLL